MKGTAAILRSHIGVGSLRILVPVLLVMAAAGAFLLVTSPAAAGPPIDDLNLPVEVEETRDVPKRVQRQVQGQGVSITQQATPTPGKLVGNTGQTSTVLGFTVTSDHSQAFTTGSNRAAYKLTHIAILLAHLGGGQQAAYSVYIAEDSGGRPGTSLGTLSGSPTLTNNPTAYAFTATGDGIDLEPDTTYWVVVDADLGGATNTGTRVAAIDADGEDSDGADGWSLADNLFYRPQSQTSASAWQAHASSSLALRVNGYVKPPPALVSAEVNETSLVLTFDKDLDTTSRPAARQFGIKFGGGGKLQRATRISISGRQVTLTVPEVRVGQLVTVSYTVPTSNRLKGSDGPEVDAIVNYTVKVNTGPAYGRLPEGSEKVRDAVYVTYNNANGEEETVENRAASADCETLYDYFYDSCQSRKNLSASAVAHDYSQHTVIDLPGGGTKRVMTQAANGWKWVWVLDANGAVIDTTAQTVAECASSALYHRQAFCRNLTDGQLPEGAKESTCPTDRTW